MASFLGENGLGLSVSLDSTGMRLCADATQFRPFEVMVTCVTAFNSTGEMKLSPVIARPTSGDSNGLLGCLGLKNIGIEQLREDSGKWSFLLVMP